MGIVQPKWGLHGPYMGPWPYKFFQRASDTNIRELPKQRLTQHFQIFPNIFRSFLTFPFPFWDQQIDTGAGGSFLDQKIVNVHHVLDFGEVEFKNGPRIVKCNKNPISWC